MCDQMNVRSIEISIAYAKSASYVNSALNIMNSTSNVNEHYQM